MKARLQPIGNNEHAAPIGPAVEVQFNPTTLRLQLSSRTDPTITNANQRAQYLGTGSATLSVELVFDTADEGTTAAPKSVLDKTGPIEQMLRTPGPQKDPPKVRFEWGQFMLAGIVESMTLDLELFSDSGVPLRAKISLSICEQRSDFEFLRVGPGAIRSGSALLPGQAGLGAVGGGSLSLGFSAGVRTTEALGGESAAELAARVGVDPAAWRAIAGGQEGSSLALAAGASVDFTIGISAGVGVGARPGALAGAAPASLDESFGLVSPPGAGTAATPDPAGFTLAAAGGVQVALGTVEAVRSEAAAGAARRAFGGSLVTATPALPTAASTPRPARPDQPRRPLYLTGFPSRAEEAAAARVPPQPRPDPRAISFGLGVPLRPRRGGATDDRGALRGGATSSPCRISTTTTTTTGGARGKPCPCGCAGGSAGERSRS